MYPCDISQEVGCFLLTSLILYIKRHQLGSSRATSNKQRHAFCPPEGNIIKNNGFVKAKLYIFSQINIFSLPGPAVQHAFVWQQEGVSACEEELSLLFLKNGRRIFMPTPADLGSLFSGAVWWRQAIKKPPRAPGGFFHGMF